MNSDDLRAVQAPLKDRYKAEPAAALVTLRASGTLGENVTCKVETGKALVAAGLHPATAATAPMPARATCSSRRSPRARA